MDLDGSQTFSQEIATESYVKRDKCKFSEIAVAASSLSHNTSSAAIFFLLNL
jgi:hypothetical protein